MNRQQQPSKWSCLITAFAIVVDKPVNEIIKAVGHDGSYKAWPHKPEPYCYVAHNPQELIYLANTLGYAVTHYSLEVVSCSEANNKIIDPKCFLQQVYNQPRNVPVSYEIEITDQGHMITHTEDFHRIDLSQKFYETLHKNKGILLGTTFNGIPHALAWDGKNIYDSSNMNITSLFEFNVNDFLAFNQIKTET